MINYTLKDNSVDQYIPIEPKQPIFGYLPKEESTAIKLTEWNYNSANPGDETTYAVSNNQDIADFTYVNSLTGEGLNNVRFGIPNSGLSPTDYIGVQKMLIPYIINSNFCDIKFLNLLQNDLTVIGSGNVEVFAEDFYESSDSNRLITLFNGLQYLRLPASKFQDSDGKNLYSKYYIKVVPKYVDLPITNIVERVTKPVAILNQSDSGDYTSGLKEHRRRLYKVNSSNLTSTPWQFENNNSQTGRFWGSTCEIWNSTLTTKKSTKVVLDSQIVLTSDSSISISPDLVGFDTAINTPVVGDVLRIFPRETYFEPIFIEVDFDKTSANFDKAIAYLTNDAVRDLKTALVEIYDENGITIDSAGNLNGTVLDSYEMSKVNDKEIRKRVVINSQNTSSGQ